jgi:hypothetical protein
VYLTHVLIYSSQDSCTVQTVPKIFDDADPAEDSVDVHDAAFGLVQRTQARVQAHLKFSLDGHFENDVLEEDLRILRGSGLFGRFRVWLLDWDKLPVEGVDKGVRSQEATKRKWVFFWYF